jgi:imidazole glycerol-phosphate synthase subunit HisH
MIALIDYGAGNVGSVFKAFEAVGAPIRLTRDPGAVLTADKVVLPGVGAFGDCMAKLQATGMVDALHEIVQRGTAFLGICVGMQVLFDEGDEMGLHAGLGVLRGRVTRFLPCGFKIPHTGWNEIEPVRCHPLLAGLPQPAWAYFNHAYLCEAQPEDVVAVTDYGVRLASVVARDNVCGIQFHPEKSQSVGLRILENFVGME